MKQQILSPSSATVWSRAQCDFTECVEPGGKTSVSWRGAEWILRFKDASVNEVIGYQVAEFLSLPVQPWLAVEVGQIEDTGIEKPNLGLLVQKWDQKSDGCSVDFPAASHPMLAGTALALSCFIPQDMEWMRDATSTELRLIDLEDCGPLLMLLDPNEWNYLVDVYLNCVRTNFWCCYKIAIPVKSFFCSALARLVEADLMGIVSFSGHSRANEITAKAASFLKLAQKILSDFSSGLVL